MNFSKIKYKEKYYRQMKFKTEAYYSQNDY